MTLITVPYATLLACNYCCCCHRCCYYYFCASREPHQNIHVLEPSYEQFTVIYLYHVTSFSQMLHVVYSILLSLTQLFYLATKHGLPEAEPHHSWAAIKRIND